MESKSDTFKKIIEKIKKVIWILGLHAFPFILLLVLVDIIFGGLIFYNYVFLAERGKSAVTGNIIKFDDKAYQSVMGKLQANGQANQASPATGTAQPPFKKSQ